MYSQLRMMAEQVFSAVDERIKSLEKKNGRLQEKLDELTSRLKQLADEHTSRLLADEHTSRLKQLADEHTSRLLADEHTSRLKQLADKLNINAVRHMHNANDFNFDKLIAEIENEATKITNKINEKGASITTRDEWALVCLNLPGTNEEEMKVAAAAVLLAVGYDAIPHLRE
mgnify:CR=1 FL=1